MNKEIIVDVDQLLLEYKNGSKKEREFLKHLFGKDVFNQLGITHRVRTFEDACCELGKNHLLVKSYEALCSVDTDDNMIAYAKLRIITTALNEGWEPTFEDGESRYYPWFYVYTPEEMEKMSEDRQKLIFDDFSGVTSRYGLTIAFSGLAWSLIYASISARLALKREELAKYCGRQFIEIWADYILTK